MVPTRHPRAAGIGVLSVLAAVGLAAAPAGAQAHSPGKPMSSQELRASHAGASMAGCYVERPEEPTWTEHMGEDGRLFDLEKDGAEVGSWWIDQGGVICFFYTDDRPPGPHCFTGRRRGPHFDYYSTLDGALIATTDCGGEPVA